ncbi:MAG TPA: indole-3-glycerol phosphate synthase TrpC [Solirubrobacteraceae bacterium]|jgi:indole-3-glycerol phosphate synthase
MSTPGDTVLDRILARTRQDLRRRMREVPLERLQDAPRPAPAASLREALLAPGVSVIAEFKRRSPSAGALRPPSTAEPHADPVLGEIVGAYRDGGAAAVSVLTEGPNFGGSLDDLRAARSACELPLLRKDFIVDRYQLEESLAAGADAVLLIVAALGPGELGSLHSAARAMGLDVLVEVHDLEEMGRAVALDAEIIGINNRDLRDFSVDLSRTERLMSHVPREVVVVSESGIVSAEQIQRLGEQGVQAVLVGESLMRSTDPGASLRALQSFTPAEDPL